MMYVIIFIVAITAFFCFLFVCLFFLFEEGNILLLSWDLHFGCNYLVCNLSIIICDLP